MKLTVREICAISMFAAVISVLSLLQIPTPSGVPFTFQTFAIVLCGCILGPEKAVITSGLYILLGSFGLPVFSGMKAGVGVLFGPTGGYLFGFLFLAFFSGWIGKLSKPNSKSSLWLYYGKGIVYGFLGLGICHLLGSLQLKFILDISLSGAFLTGSLPYLGKDILMVILAIWVGRRIKTNYFGEIVKKF